MSNKGQAERPRRYLAGLRSSREKGKEQEALISELQAIVDQQAEQTAEMEQAMQQ